MSGETEINEVQQGETNNNYDQAQPPLYVINSEPLGNQNVVVYSEPGNVVVLSQPTQETNTVAKDEDDYLMFAICATFCCFFPTGIFAILAALSARRHKASGNVERAKTSAKLSFNLIVASMFLGLVAMAGFAYFGIKALVFGIASS